MGSEALIAGRNIVSDMARNTDTNAKIRDILRRNVDQSAHTVINKLSAQGRKRNRTKSTKRGKAKKAKKQPARGKEKKKQNIKEISFPNRLPSSPKHGSGSSEFDIFAQKPVQMSAQETIETICRPIVSMDQSDLEFLIPAENDTYIDLHIRLLFRGKLNSADGKALVETSYRCD